MIETTVVSCLEQRGGTLTHWKIYEGAVLIASFIQWEPTAPDDPTPGANTNEPARLAA